MAGDKILVIDDDPDIRQAIKMTLEYEGYQCLFASSGREGLEKVRLEEPDLLFLDIKMPRMDGLEVLSRLRKEGLTGFPVVIISGHGSIQTAVDATRMGAFDFLEKPLERERLLLVVRNSLEQRKLELQNRGFRQQIEQRHRMVGESEQINRLREEISAAAPTAATVLITGESGTGKELIARAIHNGSLRAEQDFVQVNCAAIPEELIESELFGHEKGSFTGAYEKREGKFVQASGGTLFLDEIGDMSLRTQAKVLRVLEEGEVEPIGSGRVLEVDVRVLAATNKALEEEIENGNFRLDLYYRLNVVPIRSPSLRERGAGDIRLLVAHFMESFCGENNYRSRNFTDEALERLAAYHWPGNVRELRNMVERLVIMAPGDSIEAVLLPGEVTSAGPAGMAPDLSRIATLKDFKEKTERLFLVEKLKENDWNISRTASAIQTPRSNLYKKLDQFGITVESDG